MFKFFMTNKLSFHLLSKWPTYTVDSVFFASNLFGDSTILHQIAKV